MKPIDSTIAQNRTTAEAVAPARKQASLKGAFFWLSAFYVVYCARPEDWIPGLKYIPLAKISGILALLGLLQSLSRTRRKFKDLPREAGYLLGLIGILFLSGLLSPVWRGGALNHTIDFSKVAIAWILTFLLVTEMDRLRRIIYIQSASVAVICVVSVIRGHSQPRLDGVIGGIYSNPNDLAFSIVLTLPFCLAFMLTSKNGLGKALWIGGMLVMSLALFMTASRGGFVTLVITGAICLWHFGIRGKRLFLIVGSGLTVAIMLAVAGGPLMARMGGVTGSGDTLQQEKAYESYLQRKYLAQRAIEGIEQYPVLGIGIRNFQEYSGVWRDVHVTYLQIAVEGGIPSLILYLLFFGRGFGNLKKLRRRKDLDPHTTLFVGALHSSMVGFIVGALFAPEAYQFFPYFSVAYTAVLVATIREKEADATLAPDANAPRRRRREVLVTRTPDTLPVR